MKPMRRLPWLVGCALAAVLSVTSQAAPKRFFDGIIRPGCLEPSGAGTDGKVERVKCELQVEATDTAGGATPPTPSTPATPTTPPTDGGNGVPPQTPPGPSTPAGSETGGGTTAPGTSEPVDAGFAYHPPGDLLKQDQDKGRGRPKGDRKVYLKDIGYPLKLGPGLFPHMNSQIWGYGGGGWGGKGAAGGSESDKRNYDPTQQRDNYCEVRSHDMPFCPGGTGHQGQDIRPPKPENSKWAAIAVADGVITYRSDWSTLRMKAADGTTYEYLHLNPNKYAVKTGDKVKKGDVLGYVSNYMSGANGTTIHLHFNAKQLQKLNSGKICDCYVPVYSSLVVALRKEKGLDPGIDADGNLMPLYPQEIGVEKPAEPTPAPAPAPSEPTPAPAPAPSEPTPAPAPAPSEPTPAPAPAPSEPTPAPAPAPSEPTPAPAPAPSEPTPAPAPAPSEPTPAPAPAPSEPTPAPAPAPSEPTPAPAPAPSEPTPAPAPAPSEPTPAPAPAPSEPTPAPAPAPSEPTPAPAPAPSEPTPAPAPAPSEPGGSSQSTWTNFWQSLHTWWNKPWW